MTQLGAADLTGCGGCLDLITLLCGPVPDRRRRQEARLPVGQPLHRKWRRKAHASEKLLGLFVVDHVIGKHLYIDYAVALDTAGRVMRVDILQYRESYGGEVREPSWLAQFVGKTSSSPLKVGSDIRNISGATLSSCTLPRASWPPMEATRVRGRSDDIESPVHLGSFGRGHPTWLLVPSAGRTWMTATKRNHDAPELVRDDHNAP
jgi:FMN-binding domain